MAMQAHAATITVTNTNDSGPGSLRQALANANNGDTINFAVSGTITLTSGGLEVTKSVAISGPGAALNELVTTRRTFVSNRSRENSQYLRPDHQERRVWDFEQSGHGIGQ